MDPEYFNVASQMALVVKNPPANAGDLRDAGSIPGLGRFLEKGMAIGSSILAWRIPCTEEPGRLQSMGSQRVRHDSAIKKKNCSITEYWKIVLEVFENDFDVSYFGGHLKTLL